VHQPRILLLDEPTFGVDPVSRRELWLIVHEMVAEGVTAVVSTAYMDEAERFDRLALLHRGKLLAVDTPEALQEGFGEEIVEVRVERAREARERLAQFGRVAAFGDRLHLSASAARIPEITRVLNEAGFEVESARAIAPSLEDVFIGMIEEAA
jgi:ABC-2 type transport system ATP-binding protein